MIRITTTVTSKGDFREKLEKIEQAFKGRKAVKVGFPAGKSKGDVVAVAVYNHNGTSRGIPPRPFITMAMFKGRPKLREKLRNEAKKIVNGQQSVEKALPVIGLLGEGMIKKQIRSNMPPPNKASTLRRKKSTKTLIDTGRMMQSVTWEIGE